MTKIQTTDYLEIHHGQFEAFKAIAIKCIGIVKEKDRGTLQYDWFYSDDNSTCVVREQYESSEAVLEHMGNLGPTLGELLAISDLKLEVYGNPSDDVISALEGLEVKYFSFEAGL